MVPTDTLDLRGAVIAKGTSTDKRDKASGKGDVVGSGTVEGKTVVYTGTVSGKFRDDKED